MGRFVFTDAVGAGRALPDRESVGVDDDVLVGVGGWREQKLGGGSA
jgi:hypothetical protein